MKKIFTTFMVLTIFAMFFSSCEKQVMLTDKQVPNSNSRDANQENRVQNDNFDVSVNNNILCFASLDDYDNALNYLAKEEEVDFKNWNDKVNFNSMAKVCAVKKQSIPADDDILANFLNSDGVVKIKDKFFKLDFNNRLVFVYDDYNGYLNGKYTKKYSFDDEVLTLEFGTKEEIAELNSSKGGYAPNWNPGYRYWANLFIWYKIGYHKFGIYYTLSSKIKDNGCIASSINIPTVVYSWENRKKKHPSETINGTGKTCGKYKIRVYYGTKKLISYSIDADFEAKYARFPDDVDSWAHSY